ncbi:hypothetical protein [Stenotrophomonas indicatrix]|uniref:hypothetical protein n=1 Tax=Stenotrophomonas indicatrix TaxID=2045451 RepID=UPI0008BF2B3E|nr:hypothetical protein [Stenotrophomonas indicatrix]SET91516.1 hypothetical protein SAMN05720615_109222 [Stenotrophomonas indicatrix]SEU12598.1 hypothetical protein SAMN05720615_11826 [Stenotrophomonas indicatrix]
MSSPTPIITKPPKAAKSSLLPQGIAPIKDTLKHWTTWLWTALAAIPGLLFAAAMWVWHLLITSPDGLYVVASSAGMLGDAAMPAAVTAFIRVFAGVGLIAKFISQRKPHA